MQMNNRQDKIEEAWFSNANQPRKKQKKKIEIWCGIPSRLLGKMFA